MLIIYTEILTFHQDYIVKFIKLGQVIFFTDCGSSVSEHSVVCISITVVVVTSRTYYLTLNLFLTSDNCTLYLTAWLGILTFQNHACSLTLTSVDGYWNRLWLHAPTCTYSPSLPVVVSKTNGFCVTEVND